MKKKSNDKNHGVPNGPIYFQDSIDLRPVALVTQAQQHLLERIMFNFINYVKVK